MNYKIINNIELLEDFIANFLPRLGKDECYYLCLFARSKYAKNEDGSNKFPHIKTDKAQLKRFTVGNKYDIIKKLQQLECPVGSFITKDGEPIPQESLAVYMTINPRNQKKALFDLSKRLLQILESDGSNFNVHQEALSAIQRSKSETQWATFDIDSTSKEYINIIKSLINKEACKWLRTRGGYHLLVDPNRVEHQYKKTWYNSIHKLDFVDTSAGTDLMIPIPGTHQGGFTPYFENVYE